MKLMLKRAAFWLLVCGFAAASIWWMCTFPFDAARLYRAVPPDALVVTEHDNLAARWRTALENPALADILDAAGVSRRDLRSFAQDAGVCSLIERLASRRTVLAWAPASAARDAPVLVMSSWVGFQSQLFRWGFYNRAMKGWRCERTPDGTRVWSLPCSGSLRGAVLSLCVFEGVVVGALSREPQAAAAVRHRLEWDGRVMPFLLERAREGEAAAGDGMADRGWAPVLGGLHAPVRFELGGWDGDALTARLDGSIGWSPARAAGAAALPSIRSLLQGRAAAAAALSWEDLAKLLRSAAAPPEVRRVGDVVADMFAPETPAFVCLNTGDYSGRVLGLRIPSAMAGVRWVGDEAPRERLTEALDRLNSDSTWGLIPREQTESGVFSIESTRSRGVSLVGDREKPAIGRCDEWLILSSSGQVLNRFVAEKGNRTDQAGTQPFDPDEGGPVGDAAVAMWIDGETAGPAVASLLAAYELSLMARGLTQNSPAREALNRIEPWVEALGKLGILNLVITPRPAGAVRLDVSLR